jgi:DNA-binding response OmpR family regulator
MPLPLLLLVDDAPELGDILGRLGRRCGIEVEARPDVPSAWDYLQTRRPDLVLLDVNLPGVRGPQLCQRIRSAPALADLAVALFSHWGLAADVVEGLEAGADYVVSKDLVARPNELGERLHEILGAGDGRGLTAGVAWQGGLDGAPLRPDWPAALNQVLRTRAQRLLGPEVLRVVVRRALRCSRVPHLSEAVIASWLTADGFVNELPALSVEWDSNALARLGASLAEQIRRLLGAQASRPFREALAGVVPGWSGLSLQ